MENLTKREKRKLKTRKAIMMAAHEIAQRSDWNAVTIRKIADEVDYSPPVIYEHFKNKEDLILQLVKGGFRELTTNTFQEIEKVDTSDKKLLKIAEVRFDFAKKHKTLHQLMFSTEATEEHKLEIVAAMSDVRSLLFRLLENISGDNQRTEAYFINLLCLIKGFTFFQNNVSKHLPHKGFIENKHDLKQVYLDSVQRFIESIKKQEVCEREK